MERIKKGMLVISIFLFTSLGSIGFGYFYNNYVSCSQTYGFGAVDNFDGTCSCMAGYVWGVDVLWKRACVNADQKCSEEFWLGAKSDGNGYCSCKSGYVRSKNYLWKDQCVSAYGECLKISNSDFDFISQTCSCKKGYREDKDFLGNKTCVDTSWEIRSACFRMDNTEYDPITNTCNCREGYIVKKDISGYEKCVEKERSVYFTLKEVEWDKALLYSPYEKKNYKVELWSCLFLDKYLNKNIVINIGTDRKLNKWDYLVQQDDDRTCSIIEVESVDSVYTRKTCQERYGVWAIAYAGTCGCKIGYSRKGGICLPEVWVQAPSRDSAITTTLAKQKKYKTIKKRNISKKKTSQKGRKK